MVDKFKEILTQVEKKHNKVLLFALIKMDELTNKWSVVISASWITSENRKEIFKELVNIMNEKLTPEESITIARIGMFAQNENIVQELLQYKKDTHLHEKVQINGNIIHEAHILASNATLQEAGQD